MTIALYLRWYYDGRLIDYPLESVPGAESQWSLDICVRQSVVVANDRTMLMIQCPERRRHRKKYPRATKKRED
jgi:hypothetical protein